MSDGRRTHSEYLQRYATSYTGGDIESAKEHAIVRACHEEFDRRDSALGVNKSIVQTAVYGN